MADKSQAFLSVYFYEFIVYMLLEKNAFDSIAFFSQCIFGLILKHTHKVPYGCDH